MDQPLNPEPEGRAQRLYDALEQAFVQEARGLARLLASKEATGQRGQGNGDSLWKGLAWRELRINQVPELGTFSAGRQRGRFGRQFAKTGPGCGNLAISLLFCGARGSNS